MSKPPKQSRRTVSRLIRAAARMLGEAKSTAMNSYRGPVQSWKRSWKQAEPEHYALCQELSAALEAARKEAVA